MKIEKEQKGYRNITDWGEEGNKIRTESEHKKKNMLYTIYNGIDWNRNETNEEGEQSKSIICKTKRTKDIRITEHHNLFTTAICLSCYVYSSNR